ncbi:hypothetical protein G7Y89_g6494 [Cudoniella acicularis]|uniref:Isochorismatase-like domain-containing protein n=1 Tax=Cudoniella acicularis TaxID=354080 RepID=A0A8H4W5G3_9HELO|nr:hypothetical protein G7Y89_g6494 [Cudoniella acicularis]
MSSSKETQKPKLTRPPTTMAAATATAAHDPPPLHHFNIRQHPSTCQLLYLSSTADPNHTFLISLEEVWNRLTTMAILLAEARELPARAREESSLALKKNLKNQRHKHILQYFDSIDEKLKDFKAETAAKTNKACISLSTKHYGTETECQDFISGQGPISEVHALLSKVSPFLWLLSALAMLQDFCRSLLELEVPLPPLHARYVFLSGSSSWLLHRIQDTSTQSIQRTENEIPIRRRSILNPLYNEFQPGKKFEETRTETQIWTPKKKLAEAEMEFLVAENPKAPANRTATQKGNRAAHDGKIAVDMSLFKSVYFNIVEHRDLFTEMYGLPIEAFLDERSLFNLLLDIAPLRKMLSYRASIAHRKLYSEKSLDPKTDEHFSSLHQQLLDIVLTTPVETLNGPERQKEVQNRKVTINRGNDQLITSSVSEYHTTVRTSKLPARKMDSGPCRKCIYKHVDEVSDDESAGEEVDEESEGKLICEECQEFQVITVKLVWPYVRDDLVISKTIIVRIKISHSEAICEISESITLVIMAAPFNPKKTALLLLDLQVGFVQRLPQDSSVVDNAASAIAIARQHGAHIAYIRAALDEAEIEAIPDHSETFASFKGSKEMRAAIHPNAPTTQIHPKLAPKDGDFIHTKTRYGVFMTGPSKALLDDFAANGIDTVIIGGVVTSGAVLSVVRQLSDLDFQLVVLEDCCADHDAEVHKVLCEKVFPTQAKVIKTSELDTIQNGAKKLTKFGFSISKDPKPCRLCLDKDLRIQQLEAQRVAENGTKPYDSCREKNLQIQQLEHERLESERLPKECEPCFSKSTKIAVLQKELQRERGPKPCKFCLLKQMRIFGLSRQLSMEGKPIICAPCRMKDARIYELRKKALRKSASSEALVGQSGAIRNVNTESIFLKMNQHIRRDQTITNRQQIPQTGTRRVEVDFGEIQRRQGVVAVGNKKSTNPKYLYARSLDRAAKGRRRGEPAVAVSADKERNDRNPNRPGKDKERDEKDPNRRGNKIYVGYPRQQSQDVGNKEMALSVKKKSTETGLHDPRCKSWERERISSKRFSDNEGLEEDIKAQVKRLALSKHIALQRMQLLTNGNKAKSQKEPDLVEYQPEKTTNIGRATQEVKILQEKPSIPDVESASPTQKDEIDPAQMSRGIKEHKSILGNATEMTERTLILFNLEPITKQLERLPAIRDILNWRASLVSRGSFTPATPCKEADDKYLELERKLKEISKVTEDVTDLGDWNKMPEVGEIYEEMGELVTKLMKMNDERRRLSHGLTPEPPS